jgi:hypothetical protein
LSLDEAPLSQSDESVVDSQLHIPFFGLSSLMEFGIGNNSLFTTLNPTHSNQSELDQFFLKINDMAALLWWKLNHKQFPQLTKLARRYFSIPAASAEAERLFSACGRVITVERED